jgi:hypothetical protein
VARNASGTYAKPTGQPVVANTTISSSDFNSLVDDLATEVTDSLSRSAKGGMLDVLKLVDGAVGGPGVAFNSEATSGLFRAGAGDLRLAILGALVAKLTAAGLDVTGKVAATGAVSGTTGTFSGNVAGVAGAFSGAVSGTTGTFSGAVSGTTGTFSGGLGDDTSHGVRGGGALHADATGAADGFMPAADKAKLDAATDAATASTLALRDGAGALKVATPTDAAHAATKDYVDSTVFGFTVTLASQFSTTSGTLTDVTGMSFSCEATRTYRVEGRLFIGAGTAGTNQIAVACSAVADPSVSKARSHAVFWHAADTFDTAGNADLTTELLSTLAGNTVAKIDFSFHFRTSGAGTFQLQVRRSTGGAGQTLQVEEGSYLTYNSVA